MLIHGTSRTDRIPDRIPYHDGRDCTYAWMCCAASDSITSRIQRKLPRAGSNQRMATEFRLRPLQPQQQGSEIIAVSFYAGGHIKVPFAPGRMAIKRPRRVPRSTPDSTVISCPPCSLAPLLLCALMTLWEPSPSVSTCTICDSSTWRPYS